ncbi:bifunctional phosphopantothenoylcysteine decarboxylase/phosphopantothenate--cysteine ligase CoaBC [Acidihalobacter ferrooxydans]|uniref:Coenzyme A biosynthesis bifunctional protein CoaBC n=1 Tax=Acidihalobacter ferrooxydans TaxID=1765967 RepID=A0A1P8UJ59_9GAMM|nr:bifunctional phosphopantothenoylcysteine decarboxylase/phosphopantothenate--cysteine ligase CoaBC [Acidihalobacter ferrooxydans]APZ43879.1 bifunctional 4'-phosphopantothenoylcysteine decarboxylase/phosphopantothenoylcysteine synthetase [Acidihalobacter ferrooxydans]
MSASLPHRILLGVTGGIAAYKACELTRLLVKADCEVRIAMTPAATEFVTALTFQALSGRPVHTTLLDEDAEAGMGHIELARWAEAVLVAPASADFMARLAHGLADDLLTTLCLATEAPLILAPAMNRAMWANPATQANRAVLTARGITLLGPAEGAQACGETGAGRMQEPAEILGALRTRGGPLAGVRVTVTAGPTREPIDPVRVLSNRSSGRMGFAVAAAARAAGAEVRLIAGPVALPTPLGVTRIDVETAADMHAAVLAALPATDLFIASAAVADYRPAQTSDRKLKKTAESLSLSLERTPDILAEVSAHDPRPFCVGFAAETDHLLDNARTKLTAKQLDMIAANRVGHALGIEQPDNALEVLWADGAHSLPRAPKEQLARELVALIAERYRLQSKP